MVTKTAATAMDWLKRAGNVAIFGFNYGMPAYSFWKGDESLGGTLGSFAGNTVGYRMGSKFGGNLVGKFAKGKHPKITAAANIAGGMVGAALGDTAGSWVGDKLVPYRRTPTPGNAQGQYSGYSMAKTSSLADAKLLTKFKKSKAHSSAVNALDAVKQVGHKIKRKVKRPTVGDFAKEYLIDEDLLKLFQRKTWPLGVTAVGGGILAGSYFGNKAYNNTCADLSAYLNSELN